MPETEIERSKVQDALRGNIEALINDAAGLNISVPIEVLKKARDLGVLPPHEARELAELEKQMEELGNKFYLFLCSTFSADPNNPLTLELVKAKLSQLDPQTQDQILNLLIMDDRERNALFGALASEDEAIRNGAIETLGRKLIDALGDPNKVLPLCQILAGDASISRDLKTWISGVLHGVGLLHIRLAHLLRIYIARGEAQNRPKKDDGAERSFHDIERNEIQPLSWEICTDDLDKESETTPPGHGADEKDEIRAERLERELTLLRAKLEPLAHLLDAPGGGDESLLRMNVNSLRAEISVREQEYAACLEQMRFAGNLH